MTNQYPADMGKSPHAQISPVSLAEVAITDPYWQRRMRQAATAELHAQIALCESTGRIANLAKAAGDIEGEFEGRFFNDSDVYKVIEGAAWSCATQCEDETVAFIDRLSDLITRAQRPDGYLNSFFSGSQESERWTHFSMHELYCAGHLAQAAIAVKRVLDDDRLLDVAVRFLDHICDRFDPHTGDTEFTSGHPEIELALVEMYRVTGNGRYLRQARSFIDRRGSGRMVVPGTAWDAEYHQDQTPLHEESRIVGHAVRSMYLNTGAADVVLENGGNGLLVALDRMWESMTTRQMSVTGGIGARWETEGMGDDFELPNRAYNETCAAIGSIMWNWRMLHIQPHRRYADLIERLLYNAVLPGVADDGSCYFYQNPLADDGTHRRQEWFETACCPTNWIRLAATLPGYLFGRSEGATWVHQYLAAELAPADGQPGLVIETDYPRTGSVRLRIAGSGSHTVNLRRPEWAESVTIKAPGARIVERDNGYVSVAKEWTDGDEIAIHFPLDTVILSAPWIPALSHSVAIQRGPIVYCAEAADNGGVDPRLVDLTSVPATRDAIPSRPDDYPAPSLTASGVLSTPKSSRLYPPKHTGVELRQADIELRPYATWANGEPGPMTVFFHDAMRPDQDN